MFKQINSDYPYHLCPVCGMTSDTTSRVCSKHQSVIYDQRGNIIGYKDYDNSQHGILERHGT